MSTSKTYPIQEKKYTLAEVTPKRFAAYCELLCITDFAEMQKPEMQKKLNVAALNIFKDANKVQQMLAVCLKESSEGIDCDDLSSNIFNGILNDFFSQLLTN